MIGLRHLRCVPDMPGPRLTSLQRGRDLGIQRATYITSSPWEDAMNKTIVMIAAAAAAITFGTARAAPLPEINADDAGFSKQGLALFWD